MDDDKSGTLELGEVKHYLATGQAGGREVTSRTKFAAGPPSHFSPSLATHTRAVRGSASPPRSPRATMIIPPGSPRYRSMVASGFTV